ncbi:ATP-dependent nuclease [Saccharothrix syringae]|uniref:DUF2813 domain-containing protein n=1 Tax=Saccharothrix syringae TaxID=103733 RepID=A0A5Q0GWQ9_SACSY|nr:AAA family ATPase [Saccharothrix syringae]QFZ18546.1 DUF2813 domain-containing protein [Saccharothrix syringae]
MRIDHVRVKNFRNLADVDLVIQPGAVIVGENRAGKSNLLHAVRLVLDPTLSGSDRHLRREDFWDGLSDGADDWDPMAAREVIEISVDLVDFDHEIAVLTALSDALVQQQPMRARLTYRFAPVDTGTDEADGKVKYRAIVFGGDNDDLQLASDLRGYLYLVFLHALRDVETDLNSWRRSPLRVLLEAAADTVSEDDLGVVREAMKEANDKVNQLEEVKQVGSSISERITDIVGVNQALQTELAVAPDDPLRLIRNMRLFVDGTAHRHLSTTSVGTLNVLYFALLELGMEQRLRDLDIAHVVMAVEEPEAHLHPHMQRLLFRRLLTDDRTARSVLVTTQSPHIASVASPRSLVVLRNVDGRTEAAAAHTAELGDAEWDDISRYLDATRAELVFARRVLLVEGYAEQVLVPQLAEAAGMDLDKLGITICAIHGTHFKTYVRFCQALGIPWAVITDGDAEDAGITRAQRLVTALGESGAPETHGIFVGTTTFEYDLLAAHPTNREPCFAVLRALGTRNTGAAIDAWGATPPTQDSFIDMIDKVGGKGRYAHRLSQHRLHAPDYVLRALSYLAQ